MKILGFKKALRVLIVAVAVLSRNQLVSANENFQFRVSEQGDKAVFSSEKTDAKAIKLSITDASENYVFFEK